MLSQKIVQGMAADVEAVADVLTLEAHIGVETFGADSGIDVKECGMGSVECGMGNLGCLSASVRQRSFSCSCC